MTISKDTLRAARTLPIIGQAASLARSRETLNEKGLVFGSIDIFLDQIPVVGRVKGLFELVSDDIVEPSNIRRAISRVRNALDEVEGFLEADERAHTGMHSSAAPQQSAQESAQQRRADLRARLQGGETAKNTSEEVEQQAEQRYYPENSARLAVNRAKDAIKPAYERREYPGLAN